MFSDIRNSKVVDLVRELENYALTVEVIDPYADPGEVKEEYQLELSKRQNGTYDVVIIAVSHDVYVDAAAKYDHPEELVKGGVLMDIKGVINHPAESYHYWRL